MTHPNSAHAPTACTPPTATGPAVVMAAPAGPWQGACARRAKLTPQARELKSLQRQLKAVATAFQKNLYGDGTRTGELYDQALAIKVRIKALEAA